MPSIIALNEHFSGFSFIFDCNSSFLCYVLAEFIVPTKGNKWKNKHNLQMG